MTKRQIKWGLKVHDDVRRVLKKEAPNGHYILLRSNPYVLQMMMQRLGR
jgi:hypothetical protein